jgi:hypothetical protein
MPDDYLRNIVIYKGLYDNLIPFLNPIPTGFTVLKRTAIILPDLFTNWEVMKLFIDHGGHLPYRKSIVSAHSMQELSGCI